MVGIEGAAIGGSDAEALLQVAKLHLDFRHSTSAPDHHRTRMALEPIQSMDDIRHILGRNGTAQATVEARSADWLEENGTIVLHFWLLAVSFPRTFTHIAKFI